MGSAQFAKLRLVRAEENRISFDEWRERIELILGVEGYSLSDFPHTNLQAHYAAGHKAWRVALVMLGCQEAARR